MNQNFNEFDESVTVHLPDTQNQKIQQCMHMNAACEAFEDLKEAQDLTQASIDFVKPFDIKTMVLHHLPPIGAPDFNTSYVIKKCIGHDDMSEADAIDFGVKRVLRSRTVDMADPFFWSNSSDEKYFLPEKEEFKRRLPLTGRVKGITFVVYGSAGRNGIVTLVFRDLERRYTREEVRMLVFGFTSGHRVLCRLKEASLGMPPKLTVREKEILEWVAKGKSNGVIADIANISTHTVSTYMRRIFMKTGTNDRISAVLFAISRGIIDMDNEAYKMTHDLVT